MDHSKLWNALSDEFMSELSVLQEDTSKSSPSPPPLLPWSSRKQKIGYNIQDPLYRSIHLKYIPWEKDIETPISNSLSYHLQPLVHMFVFRCDDFNQYKNSTLKQDIKEWIKQVQRQKPSHEFVFVHLITSDAGKHSISAIAKKIIKSDLQEFMTLEDSNFRWITLKLEYVLTRSSTLSSLSEYKQEMWKRARYILHTNITRAFSIRIGFLREDLYQMESKSDLGLHKYLVSKERLVFTYEMMQYYPECLLLYEEYEIYLLSHITDNNGHVSSPVNKPLSFIDCEAFPRIRESIAEERANPADIYDYIFWRQVYMILESRWKDLYSRATRFIAHRKQYFESKMDNFYYYSLCDGLLASLIIKNHDSNDMEISLLGLLVHYLVNIMEHSIEPKISLYSNDYSEYIDKYKLNVDDPSIERFQPIFSSVQSLSTCFLGLTNRLIEKLKGTIDSYRWMHLTGLFYSKVLNRWKESRDILLSLWNTYRTRYHSWIHLEYQLWCQLLSIDSKSNASISDGSFYIEFFRYSKEFRHNDDICSLYHLWISVLSKATFSEMNTKNWKQYSPICMNFTSIKYENDKYHLLVRLEPILSNIGMFMIDHVSVQLMSKNTGEFLEMECKCKEIDGSISHKIDLESSANTIQEQWVLNSYKIVLLFKTDNRDIKVSFQREFHDWTDEHHAKIFYLNSENHDYNNHDLQEHVQYMVKSIDGTIMYESNKIDIICDARYITKNIVYFRLNTRKNTYLISNENFSHELTPDSITELFVKENTEQLIFNAQDHDNNKHYICTIPIPIMENKHSIHIHVIWNEDKPCACIGQSYEIRFVINVKSNSKYRYRCITSFDKFNLPYWTMIGKYAGVIDNESSEISLTAMPMQKGRRILIPTIELYAGKKQVIQSLVEFCYDTRYVDII